MAVGSVRAGETGRAGDPRFRAGGEFLAPHPHLAADRGVQRRVDGGGPQVAPHLPRHREPLRRGEEAPADAPPFEDGDPLPGGGQPAPHRASDLQGLDQGADAQVHPPGNLQPLARPDDIAVHPAGDRERLGEEVEVALDRPGDRGFALAHQHHIVADDAVGGDLATLAAKDFDGFRRRGEEGESGKERREQQRRGGAAPGTAERGGRRGDGDQGHDEGASDGELRPDLPKVEQREQRVAEIREKGEGVRQRRPGGGVAHRGVQPPEHDESEGEREAGGDHPAEFALRPASGGGRGGGDERHPGADHFALPPERFVGAVALEAAAEMRPRGARLLRAPLAVHEHQQVEFGEAPSAAVGAHASSSAGSSSRNRLRPRRPRSRSTPTLVSVTPRVSAISR